MSRALIFIFFTLLINVIGIGLIFPVLPDLIQELTGRDISNASVIAGWLLFAYAFPQFLFAPIMGNLSDQFGRRPILLLSLFGLGIDNLIMGFAPTIGWLFLGRILAGTFGASITTATAFIADISAPEKRAANFGMIGAAFGLGFILGPLLGGILGEYDTRLPFFAAAALSFANVIFGYFTLPESLPHEKRRRFDIKRANPFGAFKYISANRVVITLALVFLLSEIGHHAYQSTWTFFTIERFEFSAGMIGLSLAALGFFITIVNGWLIRVVIPKVGEIKAVWIGCGFKMFGLLGFGFISQSWLLWPLLIPVALGGFLNPALQGIMANETDDNAQGELQGALTSITGIAAIIGPLTMTQLFSIFTTSGKESAFYFPGIPFLTAALLLVIAIFPLTKALGLYQRKQEDIVNTQPH